MRKVLFTVLISLLLASCLIPIVGQAQIGSFVPSPIDKVLGLEWVTDGGRSTLAIAAATAGPIVVKAQPGELTRVLITTAGTTAPVIFYDNTSACSGTIIGYINNTTTDTSAVAGSVRTFMMRAANGITMCGGAASAGVTASYF